VRHPCPSAGDYCPADCYDTVGDWCTGHCSADITAFKRCWIRFWSDRVFAQKEG
jgi:hypothetical protein